MASSTNEHVVMLPFMAHGHLKPFLALATRIHQRTGFTISIACTPLNIQYLRSSVAEPNIRLIELPFSSADHGLPPNSESTENLSLELIGKLFIASTVLKTPTQNLISDISAKEGRPPICIISDVFLGWATEVAENTGTVNVTFSTGGAYGTLAYISIWMNLPHRSSLDPDSSEFSLPGFPENYRFHISQLHTRLRKADGTDSWSKFFQTQISLAMKSIGWICNTVEEIENPPLEWLKNYLNLPVWCLGPLLPPHVLSKLLNSSTLRSELSTGTPSSASTANGGKKQGISTEECLEWLGNNIQSSVLYVSFGSQNSISQTQMMELAIGLEKSEKPFIWVIRPPVEFDLRGEFRQEWLPEGFEERMRSKRLGLVVKGWAPQLEILGHESTGGFLSHCGWNSVVESLTNGVPMIGWPLAAEQSYNSRMLVEEMGVAVELTRGLQSGVSWEEVKEVVEMVMEKEGKGGEMTKKAEEIGEKIKAAVTEEGSSVKALDDFVNTILAARQKNNQQLINQRRR